MDHLRQSKISTLHKALEEVTQNYEALVKEEQKLKSNEGGDCNKLKGTVHKVLESCANQQQVNRVVYTEPEDHTRTKPLHNLNCTVKNIFICFMCKAEFETNEMCKNMLRKSQKYSKG